MFFVDVFKEVLKKNNSDFEDELHCVAVCNFHLPNREIGGLFLKNNARNTYEVKFGFNLESIDVLKSDNQISDILKQWNEGLISLKQSIRFHQISSTTKEVAERLKQRASRIDTPILKYLGYCKKTATEEKISKGRRCEYQNLIFVPYLYAPHQSENDNFLEKKLSWIVDKYKYLNQDKEIEDRDFFKQFFKQSYYQGFLPWEQNLSQRFCFSKFTPLSYKELWEYCWQEFNATKVAQIPHLIDIYLEDEEKIDIKETIIGDRSLCSTILAGGGNKPSIPYRSEQWNHWIFVKSKFVGAIVWEQQIEGYKNKSQFNFFWEKFKDIPDAEIVLEVHPINQKIEEFLMKRSVKGNNWDIEQTQKGKDVNVRALKSNKEIILAQEKMLENRNVCAISAVIFLYRNSLEELENDLADAVKKFPAGAFLREMDEVDALWLNKLPLVQNDLVRKERRLKFLSDEIPLPVVCPQSFDREGFELTTLEGHKPIEIDFQNDHRGVLTIAATGSGKTTLAIDIVDHNLGDGIKSVCVDYGNVDGTTTYTDYAVGHGKKGVNLQAGVNKFNLIQTPDLSGLSPVLQEKRELASQGFILSFLKTIILEEDRSSKTAKRVSSFLDYAIPKFYDLQEIKARFTAGYRKGLGSHDWLRMPTVVDFKDFVLAMSDIDFAGSEIFEEAKQEVLWGLNSFIHSRLGQKLSVPSEIDIEADFLCISMREARDDNEMALLSLCAQSLAINQALKHPKCNFLVDEGNIIGKNKTVLRSVAEFVVNGRKGGLFCNVIFQNVDTLVAAGDLGQAIIDNLPIKMIGSLEESAIPNLAKALKLPEFVFYENAGSRFLPDNVNLASRWLMIAKGFKSQLEHTPSPQLMAIVASNPQESKARKRYLDAYDNYLEAIARFTPEYQQARQGKKKFEDLVPLHLSDVVRDVA